METPTSLRPFRAWRRRAARAEESRRQLREIDARRGPLREHEARLRLMGAFCPWRAVARYFEAEGVLLVDARAQHLGAQLRRWRRRGEGSATKVTPTRPLRDRDTHPSRSSERVVVGRGAEDATAEVRSPTERAREGQEGDDEGAVRTPTPRASAPTGTHEHAPHPSVAAAAAAAMSTAVAAATAAAATAATATAAAPAAAVVAAAAVTVAALATAVASACSPLASNGSTPAGDFHRRFRHREAFNISSCFVPQGASDSDRFERHPSRATSSGGCQASDSYRSDERHPCRATSSGDCEARDQTPPRQDALERALVSERLEEAHARASGPGPRHLHPVQERASSLHLSPCEGSRIACSSDLVAEREARDALERAPPKGRDSGEEVLARVPIGPHPEENHARGKQPEARPDHTSAQPLGGGWVEAEAKEASTGDEHGAPVRRLHPQSAAWHQPLSEELRGQTVTFRFKDEVGDVVAPDRTRRDCRARLKLLPRDAGLWRRVRRVEMWVAGELVEVSLVESSGTLFYTAAAEDDDQGRQTDPQDETATREPLQSPASRVADALQRAASTRRRRRGVPRTEQLRKEVEEIKAELAKVEGRNAKRARKLGASLRRWRKEQRSEPQLRRGRLQRWSEQQRRAAAIRVLDTEGKQRYKNFHSASFEVEFQTAEGPVRRTAVADTGAFAGFASSHDRAARQQQKAKRPSREAGGAVSVEGRDLGASGGLVDARFTFPDSDDPSQEFVYEMELIDHADVPTVIGADFFKELRAVHDYDKMTVQLRAKTGQGEVKVEVPFSVGGGARTERASAVQLVAQATSDLKIPNDNVLRWLKFDIEADPDSLHCSDAFDVTGLLYTRHPSENDEEAALHNDQYELVDEQGRLHEAPPPGVDWRDGKPGRQIAAEVKHDDEGFLAWKEQQGLQTEQEGEARAPRSIVMNHLARIYFEPGAQKAQVLLPVRNDGEEPLLIARGEAVASLDRLEGEEVELDIEAAGRAVVEEALHSGTEAAEEALKDGAGEDHEAWDSEGVRSTDPKGRLAAVRRTMRRVGLISDTLEAEKDEDRDEDGLPAHDWRYGKSGRQIVAEVKDDDEGFLAWREVWEPQMRFGTDVEAEKREAIVKLMYAFKDTVAENPKAPPAIRGVEHAIRMSADWDGKPRRVRLRPHSPKEFQAVAEQVQGLLDNGTVKPSVSPWACGVVLVPKSDGGIRVCCDFRRLNQVTVPDSHNLPRIDDVFDKLKDATEMTALDMASGYWAVNLRKEDQEKTAFLTWSHGLVEWVRMPMGLKCSGATYQRMLQQVLGPLLWESSMNYLDDVSIFSKEGGDHVNDLSRVLKRLARWGITMKMPKNTFAAKEMPYLGFLVRAGAGICLDPSKVQGILDLEERPKTVTAVKSFLGCCSYFRRFVPGYAALAAPLQDAIKGRKKKQSIEDRWEESGGRCEAAFQSLKAALACAAVLHFPDYKEKFFIACDAANHQIGAVLFQVIDGHPRPVSYVSRRLSKAEVNYAITDKESLAAVWALRQFRKHVHGSPHEVGLLSDHIAVKALTLKDDLTPRQLRFAIELGEYPLQIMHRPGVSDVMNCPDMLSRFGMDEEAGQAMEQKLDELLLDRLSAVLQYGPDEEGKLDPAKVRELLSPENQAMRLQLLTTAAVSNEDCALTVRELSEMYHERLEERSTASKDSGEYCHIAEMMDRVVAIRRAEGTPLEEVQAIIKAEFDVQDGVEQPTLTDGEAFGALAGAVLRNGRRAAMRRAATRRVQGQKDAAPRSVTDPSEPSPAPTQRGQQQEPQQRNLANEIAGVAAGLTERDAGVPQSSPPQRPDSDYTSDEADADPAVTAATLSSGPLDGGSTPTPAAPGELAGQFEEAPRRVLLEEQAKDPFCRAMRTFLESGVRPEGDPYLSGKIKSLEEEYVLDDDGVVCREWHRDPRARAVLEPVIQAFVPTALRGAVIKGSHGGLRTGHLSPMKTWQRLRECYYWPGMYTDVFAYVRACGVCQSRGRRPPKQKIQGHVRSDVPGEVWMLDVLYFPKSKRGREHALCMVDVASRWAYVAPLDKINSASVVEAVERLIIGDGCNPKLFISDNGSEFRKDFIEFAEVYGIKAKKSVPHHAAGHGLVEAFNHTIADAIGHMIEEDGGDWEENLPWARRAYLSSPHSALQQGSVALSPAQAFRGWAVQLPLNALAEQDNAAAEGAEAVKKKLDRALLWALESRETYECDMEGTKRNKGRRNRQFDIGDKVRLYKPPKEKTRRKVGRTFEGPYLVLEVFKHNGKPSEYLLKREGGTARVRATIEQIRAFVDAATGLDEGRRDEVLQEVNDAAGRRWEVKAVLDEKGSMAKGTKKFLVDWEGDYEPTWEPEALLNAPELVSEYHIQKNKTKRRAIRAVIAKNSPASAPAEEPPRGPPRSVSLQLDLLRYSAPDLLRLICEQAAINPKDLLLVWSSPPCRTFSPADPSNLSRNNNFRDHSQPTKPPTRTNPEKARIAVEHDRLVQRILEFYEYCEIVGLECNTVMENPRGSLGVREYMQPEALPREMEKVTIDQCAFGREYKKRTDLWHDLKLWKPQGYTGDGRCGGRCGKGEYRSGFFKHYKALAMEPIRGPRGPGHTKDKNALPEALLEELADAALLEGRNPRGRVILDLCSGFQSWRPVAARLGCDYVAVDVLGDRNPTRPASPPTVERKRGACQS